MEYYKVWYGDEEWALPEHKVRVEITRNGDLILKNWSNNIIACYASGYWKKFEIVE